MRVLLVGWFSYEGYGATAGDLLARDVVLEWLREAGREVDVVTAPPFEGGVRWESISPCDYTDLVFVCGPFGNGPPITELLSRFEHCRIHGVDLSLLQPRSEWDPFDSLLERDSDVTARPDIVFAARPALVPVVGVVLVHPQNEYGDLGLHAQADAALSRLLANRAVAQVAIDTRLDELGPRSRTPAQVESLIARMDVVVTTRLHGVVLALKNGVPALPIDPIRGGAKVSRQVASLAWPILFAAESLEDRALEDAFDFCLTADARSRAERCAADARSTIERIRRDFVGALAVVRHP